MQVVLSAIDMTFLIWKRRKVRNLSDQRMGFRYSQQTLHKTV